MSRSVIIVESPAKAKTIKKFLNNQYTVKASMGHVRDLPKSQLGVNVENDFTPKYIVIKGKAAIISDLKESIGKAKDIYVATDPDREGEAIAWHLLQLLKIEPVAKRIELREITKEAVKRAITDAHTINEDKVNAQQARRILDRLVGYKLSPLLWKKVQGGLSAGRVQSVAVRLVCEREKEILAFTPEEYWSLAALLNKTGEEIVFTALLHKERDQKISIPNEESVKNILDGLKNVEFIVNSIQVKERKELAPPPFITSTLQQDASRKLGFRVARTMSIAQQLYEGLELGEEESSGLITYMRTDSIRIAPYALDEARQFVLEKFDSNYSAPRQFKANETAQDAHEAIRPTSLYREPEKVKSFLTRDQYRLYKLIWERFLASQMAPCVKDVKTVIIQAGNYQFRAVGSWIKFPGFTAIYEEGKETDKEPDPESEEKVTIPPLEEGEKLMLKELRPKQHFTQPPPRYSEATLVKALEERGIGRPSTYAPIIETIQQRGYVMQTNRKFSPTDLGTLVTDLLVQHFPDILDVTFTAEMENKLDKIEEGGLNWVEVLREFYAPFDIALSKASSEMQKVEIKPEETGELCEQCSKPMVIKRGRFGKFIACSGYPDCRNTKPLLKSAGVSCSMEGCNGQVIERRSKKGRLFYGCSAFPACTYRSWNKPTNEKCPSCASVLVVARGRGGEEKLICEKEGCGYVISRKVAAPDDKALPAVEEAVKI